MPKLVPLDAPASTAVRDLRDNKKLLTQQVGFLDAKLTDLQGMLERKKARKLLLGPLPAPAPPSEHGAAASPGPASEHVLERPWRQSKPTREKLKRGRAAPLEPLPVTRPLCAGSTLQRLRVRDALRKVDNHLYQLALPPMITDQKGWVIRERPSDHQIHDKSRSNPVLASVSWGQ